MDENNVIVNEMEEENEFEELDDELKRHLCKKITEATDSRDALNYAKAYGEVQKYNIERYKTECDVYDKHERREMDKLKILDDQAFNTQKLNVEKEKVEADRARYRADERSQRYRADRQSKDNKLALAAFVLGYGVTLGTEVKGILMSKGITSLRTLIKLKL